MKHNTFNKLLDTLESSRVTTLKEKNARYSDPDDALHNFSQGAEIMGCTPAQCAWNYATKHIVALRDMIIRNDFSNREDVLEKIQDIQNYLSFIWCIANDGKTTGAQPINPIKKTCANCEFRNEPFFEEPCCSCPSCGINRVGEDLRAMNKVKNDLQSKEN